MNFLTYESLADQISDAVVSINADGIILHANKACEKLFGYEPCELLGKNVDILVPSPHKEYHSGYIKSFIEGRAPKVIGHERKLLAQRKDGSTFHIELNVSQSSTQQQQQQEKHSCPFSNSGSTTQVFDSRVELFCNKPQISKIFTGIIRDISEKEHQENKITQLKAANYIKNEYLSRMSHELRTPLNSIIGFSQLLDIYSDLGSEDKEYAHLIYKSGKHLLGLIDDVLNISKIESGAQSFSLEDVKLDGVLNEVKNLVEYLAQTKNIKIILDPSVKGWYVFSDQQKLKQIFINLLSNGIKYNIDDGTITISVQVINPNDCDDEDSKTIQINVQDTGIGLEPHQLARIFTAFDRLGAESSDIEGSGLGLCLCKALATGMGCSISVFSKGKDQGSTFQLTCSATKNPRMKEYIEAKSDICNPMTFNVVDKKNILYIEDNIANFMLVQKLIQNQRCDITVSHAIQGRLGIDLALQLKPPVILLDLHLPDMHGSQVLKELVDHPSLGSTKIVVLSADANKRQMNNILNLGAAEYLTKPIDIGEFNKMLNKYIPSANMVSKKQTTATIDRFVHNKKDINNTSKLYSSTDLLSDLHHDIFNLNKPTFL